MTRELVALAVLATITGCAPSTSQKASSQTNGGKDAHLAEANTTSIIVTETGLTFDPRTCERGQAGFNYGLGSVNVNVLGRDDGFCIFDYTIEEEGESKVYRCRVPADGQQIKIFKIYKGSPTVATSFSLEKSRLIRRSSLLLDPGSSPPDSVEFQSQTVPGTDHVNAFYDVVEGTGVAAKDGSRVEIKYAFYDDWHFYSLLPGVEKDLRLKFAVGKGDVDDGLKAAVQGMKAGGKRRVMIFEAAAPGLAKRLGGVRAGTQLAVEIELSQLE